MFLRTLVYMQKRGLSSVYSAALSGIDAHIVHVETEVTYGLRSFSIIGLADKSVQESAERIGSALKSSGFKSPHTQPIRTLVNLAPADMKKEGTMYDLPIALGFLLASGQAKFPSSQFLAVGELSLNGTVRPVKGSLGFALLSQKKHISALLVPAENAKEAAFALLNDQNNVLRIIPVRTLKEAVGYLQEVFSIEPAQAPSIEQLTQEPFSSFSLIRGQHYAKRALEIAAAGRHNIFFYGPPGTGKTLLAKAISEILPSLSFEQSLQVTRIWSIAGLLSESMPFLVRPPFRNPHHTSSEASVIGGGNPPRPGEITLAHQGVLFLDEFPEYHRDALESLREPIEQGEITLLRARHHIRFPASFMLVAAANPCPCGFYQDSERDCQCPQQAILKYRRKLSGPLMDRMDMLVHVPQVTYKELSSMNPDPQQIFAARNRVLEARSKQHQRFKDIRTNAQMNLKELDFFCSLDIASQQMAKKYVDSGKLSARGYHRVLKVARTIADLAGEEKILFEHFTEALSYRIKEVV